MDRSGQGNGGLAIEGLGVALATPFTPEGTVDLGAFRRLVRHVVAGGTDLLVPLGSTGEAATLREAERDAIIEACLEECGGRPVIVGTGSNATAQAAAFTRRAQALGASGALVVTPYYNKPGLPGLLAHYAAVADAAPGLPLVAYNVPGRTGLNLTPAMLARLWELPQVVAVKESSGSLVQIGAILAELPPGKRLLAGDDNLALATLASGGAGLISVLGNALPAPTAALVRAARAGRTELAQALHRALLPVMDALFAESNPIPLKAALQQLGLCGDGLRLPLTPAAPETRARLQAALRGAQAALAPLEGALAEALREARTPGSSGGSPGSSASSSGPPSTGAASSGKPSATLPPTASATSPSPGLPPTPPASPPALRGAGVGA